MQDGNMKITTIKVNPPEAAPVGMETKLNIDGEFPQDAAGIKRAAESPSYRGSEEEDGGVIKVAKWSEFTQNTTFHGVKYIFDQTPLQLRR